MNARRQSTTSPAASKCLARQPGDLGSHAEPFYAEPVYAEPRGEAWSLPEGHT